MALTSRYCLLILGMTLNAAAVRGLGGASLFPIPEEAGMATGAASAKPFDLKLLGNQAPQQSATCASAIPPSTLMRKACEYV